jgi:hypothetical protein
MNKIIEFVIKHKFIITIIILLLFIIYIGWSSPYNKYIEGFNEELEPFLNKKVFLKLVEPKSRVLPDGTKIETEEVFYLSLAKNTDCDIKKDNLDDCTNNIAILKPTVGESSKFLLKRGYFSDTRYTINSTVEDIIPYDTLSQTLNYYKKSDTNNDKLCFDIGTGHDDIVRFDLVKNSLTTPTTYKVKFRKPKNMDFSNNEEEVEYENFYLSKCEGQNKVCLAKNGTMFTRCCVSNNESDALSFEILLAEKPDKELKELEESEEESEELEESSKENTSLMKQEDQTIDQTIEETQPLIKQEEVNTESPTGQEIDLYSLGGITQEADNGSVDTDKTIEGYDTNTQVGAFL